MAAHPGSNRPGFLSGAPLQLAQDLDSLLKRRGAARTITHLLLEETQHLFHTEADMGQWLPLCHPPNLSLDEERPLLMVTGSSNWEYLTAGYFPHLRNIIGSIRLPEPY